MVRHGEAEDEFAAIHRHRDDDRGCGDTKILKMEWWLEGEPGS
jgi:hypothetical protein